MKQTAQEKAKEMCEAWGIEDNHGYGVKDTFQVGFVHGANWQAEKSPWISVEDRLPNNDENVFYANHLSLAFGVGFYVDNQWYQSYTGEEIHGITVWMPIPKFNE